MPRLGSKRRCGLWRDHIRGIDTCAHCDLPCLKKASVCPLCIRIELGKEET